MLLRPNVVLRVYAKCLCGFGGGLDSVRGSLSPYLEWRTRKGSLFASGSGLKGDGSLNNGRARPT